MIANDDGVIYSRRGKTSTQKFTFIDLFAGIGGIRLAFEGLGGHCVYSSEWDKFAAATYYENFGEYPDGDITKIESTIIPDFQILTAGFPCQPFSIAGVSKKNSLGRKHGFLDETQGTLFFDVARIINDKRPIAFLLENVKNLVSHDKGKTFEIITRTLKSMNYSLFYKVVDAKYYVPQHRERIIIVGFDNISTQHEKFTFPDYSKRTIPALRSILQSNVDPKYTLSDKLWKYLQEYSKKQKEKGNGFGFGLCDLDSIARTLSARYYKDGSEILIPQTNMNPRKLTPRECARLQGFPESYKINVSDMQAYKQFGNSVAVPVITDIAKNMLKVLQLSFKSNFKNEERISIGVL